MTDQGIDPLVRLNCIACRRGEPTVTDAEIARFHPQIPDWEVVEVAGVRGAPRAGLATSTRFGVRVPDNRFDPQAGDIGRKYGSGAGLVICRHAR